MAQRSDAKTELRLQSRLKNNEPTEAKITTFPNFLSKDEADGLLRYLKTLQYEQMIQYNPMIGYSVSPRLMLWITDDPTATYAFSSNSIGGYNATTGVFHAAGLAPHPWTPELRTIRRLVSAVLGKTDHVLQQRAH